MLKWTVDKKLLRKSWGCKIGIDNSDKLIIFLIREKSEDNFSGCLPMTISIHHRLKAVKFILILYGFFVLGGSVSKTLVVWNKRSSCNRILFRYKDGGLFRYWQNWWFQISPHRELAWWRWTIKTPMFRFVKLLGSIEIGLGNHYFVIGWDTKFNIDI